MNNVDSSQRWPIFNWASQLEEQAANQARNIASLPFIHRHVALMPDAHLGKGSTIGTVIATKGAVLPSATGVDLGCGMSAQALGISAEKLGGDGRLRELRRAIERAVPVGFGQHRDPVGDGSWWGEQTQTRADRLGDKRLGRLGQRAGCQLGTLGGGNHFIEICTDELNRVWVMLHSGSRGMGNTLANWHIDHAKADMKRYFISLPDPDLAYFVEGTPQFQAYIDDMMFAQEYALANRREMMQRVLVAVCGHVGMKSMDLPEVGISCHHNYCTREHHFGANVWVTRKGAVMARKGEKAIIPGSMGTRSYIVEGLGNPDSFESCAHGAGRAMGRKEARRRYTVKDLVAQTEGVECRKDDGVLDELPAAYKCIDKVMADQTDLVRPLHTLKAILCVKG